jgi:hypothetical protein
MAGGFRRGSRPSLLGTATLARWSEDADSVRTDTRRAMSSRLEKSWTVLVSHQTAPADRCVDLFSRPDGTFGFEEFRRDPEDMGAWTPISYFSGLEYPTEPAALAAALQAVPWLRSVLDG